MTKATSLSKTARGVVAGSVLAAALLGAAGAEAASPVLYGATGVNANDTAPASNLYTVNPDTGAATTIGPIGRSITGLAVDATSGGLYGVTGAVSESTTERFLLKIDPATGAATQIGSIGTNNIEDIAFNAAGQLFGWNETGDDLTRIDKATAALSPVGESGQGVTFGDGMSFDKNGTLFAMVDGDFGRLSIVNPSTGTLAEEARLTGSPVKTGAAVNAASFGCDGTSLFAVVNDFGGPAYLVTVNPVSGKITTKGATVAAMDALAWSCPAVAPAPAPQTPAATPGPVPGPATAFDRRKGSLSVKTTPTRDRSFPLTFTTTGKLTLPSGLTAAEACTSVSRVVVRVKLGDKTLSSRRVSLSKTCTYRSSVTFRSKSRFRGRLSSLRIDAFFNGNARVLPVGSKRLSVSFR